MKRTERHHLKQDEFVHWLDQVFVWARDNKKNLVNALLVVTGAGLLLGGIGIYRSRQGDAARASMDAALEQYHGVVISGTGAAPAPGVPTFDSAKERYETALAAFEDVVASYGSYEPARQARYYAGICLAELSRHEEAVQAFAAVREGPRDLLYYLGSRSLASAKVALGQSEEASEIYRNLIEDPENPLPKDHLLFALAQNEERAGNSAEAKRYYDRVLEEHPSSQLRGDALTRSEILELSGAEGAKSSD